MAVIFSPTTIDIVNIMFSDQGYSLQSVSGFAFAVPIACCHMDFFDIFSFLFIPQYRDYLTKKKAKILYG